MLSGTDIPIASYGRELTTWPALAFLTCVFVCVSISSSTPVFPTLLYTLQDYIAWVIS